jgi:hypothetical protein
MSQDFNVNDPKLLKYVPTGFDPSADIPERKFAPPLDGKGYIRLFMREPSESKPNPYVKGTPQDANVLVRTRPRIEKEDGTLGAYLADFYPMTKVIGNNPTSSMHMLAKQAGIDLPVGLTAGEIIEKISLAFEEAGEEGIRVYAKYRLYREIPREGDKPERISGRQAVFSRNLADAEALAEAQTHLSEEDRKELVKVVAKEPWKYYDNNGELREAKVTIDQLVAPK